MISLEVYKLTHLTGVFFVVASLAAISIHTLNGGTRNHSQRKLAAITHGVGLILVLLGGFGMLARIGVSGVPAWVGLKMLIWLGLGGMVAIAYRARKWGALLFWAPLLLAVLAAFLGIFKP